MGGVAQWLLCRPRPKRPEFHSTSRARTWVVGLHPTPRRAVHLGQTVHVPLASMFVSHGLPPPPVLPLPWSLKSNNGNAPGEDGQHRKGPAQGDLGVTAEVSRGALEVSQGCGSVRPGGQWGSWTVSSCRSHSSVRLVAGLVSLWSAACSSPGVPGAAAAGGGPGRHAGGWQWETCGVSHVLSVEAVTVSQGGRR